MCRWQKTVYVVVVYGVCVVQRFELQGRCCRNFHDCYYRNADKKAAIGYTYEDSTPVKAAGGDNEEEQNSDEDSSDTDVETADLGNTSVVFLFLVTLSFSVSLACIADMQVFLKKLFCILINVVFDWFFFPFFFIDVTPDVGFGLMLRLMWILCRCYSWCGYTDRRAGGGNQLICSPIWHERWRFCDVSQTYLICLIVH